MKRTNLNKNFNYICGGAMVISAVIFIVGALIR